MGAVPYIIRADRGTENVNIEMVQRLLRSDHADERSRNDTVFLYGRSSANQRIESWWSKFPGFGMESWIEHFKFLQHHGILDTSIQLHIDLVRFCYMPLLKTELEKVQTEWNSHRIRPARGSLAPPGKPDFIYNFPELYDSHSYLTPVDAEMLDILSEISCYDLPVCAPTSKALFDNVSTVNDIQPPETLVQAATNFALILDTIEN